MLWLASGFSRMRWHGESYRSVSYWGLIWVLVSAASIRFLLSFSVEMRRVQLPCGACQNLCGGAGVLDRRHCGKLGHLGTRSS